MRPASLDKLGEDTRARLRAWKPGVNIFSVISEADLDRLDDDEGISAAMLYELSSQLKRQERNALKCKKRYWKNPEKARARARAYNRKKQQSTNVNQLIYATRKIEPTS